MSNVHETTDSVAAWARETFGRPKSNLQLILRARREMEELVDRVTIDSDDAGIPEEIADVVIVLMPVLANFMTDLQSEINAKMAINRKRKWNTRGDGVGQHIPE